jgi:hypothetical protein
MSIEEERQFDIQEAGKAAFDERMAGMSEEDKAGLSAVDRQMAAMDSMARAAADQGDMGTYAQLLDAMHQTSQADRLNEAKIAELEGKSFGGDQWSFDRIRRWWPSGQREQYQQTYLAANKGMDTINSVVDLVEEVAGEGQDRPCLW